MKRKILSVWVMVMTLVALLPSDAHAYLGLCCGKCGGNMPMNIPGGGVPENYEFRFKIQPSFMRMNGLRSGASNVDGNSLLGMPVMMGMPTGKFMAVQKYMNMSMQNIALGYSFSDNFFAGVMGMYQDNRMGMAFNSMMTAMTGQTSYIMKSSGFADTMLMTKYRLYADDPLIPTSQFSLFTGASLPSGSISERNTTHPLAVRQTELLPYGMQLGSGTVDPILGLLYQGSKAPWWWGLDGTYTGRWYDNSRNYQLGDVYKLDAYLMNQISYNFLWQAQVNVEWKGRIHGQADEAMSGFSGHATHGNAASPFMTPLWNPANYGGVRTSVTLGVQWQPVPLHILELDVKLPVYQRLNGVQLKDQFGVMLTWYVEIPTSKSIRSLTHPVGKAISDLGF
ncbi:MAG: hypothetical protein Q9M27_02775 [Mariprofundaceae bacterium]|nr:hypothetical protein [Mariprofundaceae bacterium]